MTDIKLEALLAEVKRLQAEGRIPTEDADEQRISFVYGNCKLDNDAITREMVFVAAADMKIKKGEERSPLTPLEQQCPAGQLARSAEMNLSTPLPSAVSAQPLSREALVHARERISPSPRLEETVASCKKCYRAGWYPDTEGNEDGDDYSYKERYCDCPFGDIRRMKDGGEEE